MTNFKKLFTGMLAAAMCFSFAACGDAKDNSDNSAGGQESVAPVDAVVYDGLELHYQSSD